MTPIRTLDQLAQTLKGQPPRRVVVAAGHDPNSIQAANRAAAEGIAKVTLVGDQARIEIAVQGTGPRRRRVRDRQREERRQGRRRSHPPRPRRRGRRPHEGPDRHRQVHEADPRQGPGPAAAQGRAESRHRARHPRLPAEPRQAADRQRRGDHPRPGPRDEDADPAVRDRRRACTSGSTSPRSPS